MAQFIRNVTTSHELVNDIPDRARIDIDEKLARRILHLAKEVKRLGVYQISEFEYTPDFYETGVKDPDWRVDCVILEVSDSHFRWTALVKHTNIELVTDVIYIKDLLKKFPHLKG